MQQLIDDVAFLALFLAARADAGIDREEAAAIARSLFQLFGHSPEQHEMVRTALGESEAHSAQPDEYAAVAQRIAHSAMENLGATKGPPFLAHVLGILVRVAMADGSITGREGAFLDLTATMWSSALGFTVDSREEARGLWMSLMDSVAQGDVDGQPDESHQRGSSPSATSRTGDETRGDSYPTPWLPVEGDEQDWGDPWPAAPEVWAAVGRRLSTEEGKALTSAIESTSTIPVPLWYNRAAWGAVEESQRLRGYCSEGADPVSLRSGCAWGYVPVVLVAQPNLWEGYSIFTCLFGHQGFALQDLERGKGMAHWISADDIRGISFARRTVFDDPFLAMVVEWETTDGRKGETAFCEYVHEGSASHLEIIAAIWKVYQPTVEAHRDRPSIQLGKLDCRGFEDWDELITWARASGDSPQQRSEPAARKTSRESNVSREVAGFVGIDERGSPQGTSEIAPDTLDRGSGLGASRILAFTERLRAQEDLSVLFPADRDWPLAEIVSFLLTAAFRLEGGSRSLVDLSYLHPNWFQDRTGQVSVRVAYPELERVGEAVWEAVGPEFDEVDGPWRTRVTKAMAHVKSELGPDVASVLVRQIEKILADAEDGPRRRSFLAAVRGEEAPAPVATEVGRATSGTAADSVPSAVAPYEVAVVAIDCEDDRLDLVRTADLALHMAHVARVEGPIHIEVLISRLVAGAGLGRAGSRIREAMEAALGYGETEQSFAIDGDFVWPSPPAVRAPRDRSDRPATERRPEYIAPEEWEGAVLVALGEEGLHRDELIRVSGAHLGYRRISKQVRDLVEDAIHRSLQVGRIRQRGATLEVAPGEEV